MICASLPAAASAASGIGSSVVPARWLTSRAPAVDDVREPSAQRDGSSRGRARHVVHRIGVLLGARRELAPHAEVALDVPRRPADRGVPRAVVAVGTPTAGVVRALGGRRPGRARDRSVVRRRLRRRPVVPAPTGGQRRRGDGDRDERDDPAPDAPCLAQRAVPEVAWAARLHARHYRTGSAGLLRRRYPLDMGEVGRVGRCSRTDARTRCGGRRPRAAGRRRSARRDRGGRLRGSSTASPRAWRPAASGRGRGEPRRPA